MKKGICLLLACLILISAGSALGAKKKTVKDIQASMEGLEGESLRLWCQDQFASAQHSDPAEIPYPKNRLENGYLPEGEPEFLYEDEEKGLWAYASQSLQVQIVRYAMAPVLLSVMQALMKWAVVL